MKTELNFPLRGLLLLGLVAAGCAPTLVLSAMPNPARTTEKIESSQTYEIGPFKENHQYELGLYDWTPTSIGLHVKLTDTDRCASPKSYTFTLVDEHGARADLQPAGEPVVTTQPGREKMSLTVATLSGTFPMAIGKDAKYVLVQLRPLYGVDCPALDFKWTLQ